MLSALALQFTSVASHRPLASLSLASHEHQLQIAQRETRAHNGPDLDRVADNRRSPAPTAAHTQRQRGLHRAILRVFEDALSQLAAGTAAAEQPEQTQE